MTNITILYQGGSGGFALYYYLLLSGNYQYTIAETQQLISQQFQDNLKNFPEQWKNKEFWPDNQQLKNQDGSKVFLICNPLFNPDMLTTNLDISDRTHKILLYVDLKLQLRMAYEKQAYWFTKVSKTKFSAPDKLNQYLRQIIISGDEGFDPQLKKIREVFRPDQEIRLEEFLQKKVVTNFAEPNTEQIKFLNNWLSLQPAKALKLLER